MIKYFGKLYITKEAEFMANKKETAKKEAVKKTAVKKIETKKVSFELQDIKASEVYLAGDFNNWDNQATPMKRNKKGIWNATVPLIAGKYEYRFLVDGIWENDPACSSCVPNRFGSANCVKIVE